MDAFVNVIWVRPYFLMQNRLQADWQIYSYYAEYLMSSSFEPIAILSS